MIKENFDLIIVAFALLSILLYDVMMDLFLNMLHLLFEALHIAYEWLELGIEHIVEHLFHTSRHGGQIITFYILLLIACLAGYWIWRVLPRAWRRITGFAQQSVERRKTECQVYWMSLPLPRKMRLISSAMGMIFLTSYFVI